MVAVFHTVSLGEKFVFFFLFIVYSRIICDSLVLFALGTGIYKGLHWRDMQK